MPISGSDPVQRHARLGVLRLATGRLGAFRPITLKTTINGTACQIDKAESRLSFLDRQPWTATLRVRGLTPSVGQAVLVGVGDTAAGGRIFQGRIQRVTRIPKARTADVDVWDIECVDPTWELDKRLVLKRYATQPVVQLLQDLLATYTSGFTLDVQGDLGTLAVDFTFERPSQCLTRICDAIGADWQVDPFKRVRVFLADAKRPAPKTLDASCPYEFRDLSWTTDYSQTRTRVIVEGVTATIDAMGRDDPDLGRDLLTIDGGSYLAAVFRSLDGWPVVPTQEVRSQQTRWFASVVADDGDTITLAKSDDKPAVYVGDEVSLIVAPEVQAVFDALIALEGGDGIRDSYIQDRRLTKAGALARAAAERTLYAAPITTVTFASRDPAFLPGVDAVIDVDGLSGTFRVRRVDLDTLEDTTARFPLRRIEASSVRQDFYDVLRRIERGGLR